MAQAQAHNNYRLISAIHLSFHVKLLAIALACITRHQSG